MNKTIWIILLVIIVLAIAGGIYWYFKIRPKNIQVTVSPSATLSQTLSPANSATPALGPSASRDTKQTVKVFMIAVDDNGASGKKIGCGDSAVAVTREIAPTQAVLRAAMTELLSIKDKNYGQSGLYNSLYRYNLNVESVTIDDNGKATIKLSGDFTLVGTCEDPRIEAQLRETAMQFPTVKSADIFINDKNLTEIMSLEGA